MKLVPTLLIVGCVSANDAGNVQTDQTPTLVGAGAKKADVIFQRSPLRCDCPTADGFVLRDDFVCERLAEIPLVAQCPASGYRLVNQDGTDVCIRERYPNEVCEDYGYARVRNLCVRREVTIPQLACAEGFELELNPNLNQKPKYEELVCSARVAVQPVLECPDGTTFNGICEDAERVPAEFACPPGFDQISPTTCNQVSQVLCNTGKAKGLGGGYGGIGHGKLRRLDAAEAEAEETKEMENAAEEEMTGASHNTPVHAGWDRDVNLAAINGRPAEPKHANQAAGAYGYGTTAGYKPWVGFKNKALSISSNLLNIQETCLNNVTIAATPFCERGRLQGNYCLIPSTSTSTAVEVCPAYGTPDGNCFAIERRSPRSICPEGFTEECTRKSHAGGLKSTVDCECVFIDQRPVVVTCNPGFDLIGGLCVATAQPVLACPRGVRSATGTACIVRESVPARCSYFVELGSYINKKDGKYNSKYENQHDYIGRAHGDDYRAYGNRGDIASFGSQFDFEAVSVRPVKTKDTQQIHITSLNANHPHHQH